MTHAEQIARLEAARRDFEDILMTVDWKCVMCDGTGILEGAACKWCAGTGNESRLVEEE